MKSPKDLIGNRTRDFPAVTVLLGSINILPSKTS